MFAIRVTMASNTRYAPAPQRDSIDDQQHYTQPPPSYQAASNPTDGLLGTPRSEDDNVPDDFKVSYFHFGVNFYFPYVSNYVFVS